MHKIFICSFALVVSIFGCRSSQKNATENILVDGDSLVVEKLSPDCIKQIIKQFEAEPVQNPPRRIYSFNFRNQTVYYVPPICCDMFSDLYDENCKLMGHPDGGFTGRGDGQLSGFGDSASNKKIVWADKRK